MASEAENTASLIGFDQHTPGLATFTFKLSHPVKYTAGQHIILDCASLLDPRVKEYKHMSDKYGGEKELNDTGVRTWTISSAPSEVGKVEDTISVTMRRVEEGLITPRLFEVGREGSSVTLPVLGVGGEFVLPRNLGQARRNLLFVASGVGITPFLSFLSSLSVSTSGVLLNITLIVAVRRAEAAAMLDFVHRALASSPSVPGSCGKLNVHIVSSGIDATQLVKQALEGGIFEVAVTTHDARLSSELLLSLSQSAEQKEGKAEAWVCGPPSLETSVLQTLEGAGWPAEKVHRESFAF